MARERASDGRRIIETSEKGKAERQKPIPDNFVGFKRRTQVERQFDTRRLGSTALRHWSCKALAVVNAFADLRVVANAAKYKHDAAASVFPVSNRLADVRLRDSWDSRAGASCLYEFACVTSKRASECVGEGTGHTRWRVVLVLVTLKCVTIWKGGAVAAAARVGPITYRG